MLINSNLIFHFALLVSSATIALVQADSTNTNDAPAPKPKPKPSPGSGKGNSNDGDDISDGDNYCKVNSFSNLEKCGTNGLNQLSFCILDVEGGYQCVADSWCVVLEARPCTLNSDCVDGWVCSDQCGSPGCAPLCTNQGGPFDQFVDDIVDDPPYYDDANDFCYPPDYVASEEVPLDKKIFSDDHESIYSYAMKERDTKSSLTHSNSVADDYSSLHTPLNVALLVAVAAVVLAVALTVFRVYSSSQNQNQQFTELPSSSEHSIHANTKVVEVELERVSPSFDSLMKL